MLAAKMDGVVAILQRANQLPTNEEGEVELDLRCAGSSLRMLRTAPGCCMPYSLPLPPALRMWFVLPTIMRMPVAPVPGTAAASPWGPVPPARACCLTHILPARPAWGTSLH